MSNDRDLLELSTGGTLSLQDVRPVLVSTTGRTAETTNSYLQPVNDANGNFYGYIKVFRWTSWPVAGGGGLAGSAVVSGGTAL